VAQTSRADKLKRYRHKVDHAVKWRTDEGYDDTWGRMIDLYRGRHFPDASTEDRIKINIAFSTINVIFPSITVNHPKVAVSATKPEDEDKAVIAEAVLNYWWRHYDFKRPFRDAAKDFLIIGHGWLKVGWQYAEQDSPLNDTERAAEAQAANAQLDEYAAENPDMAGDLPTREEVEDALPSTKIIVTEDRPTLERVSPFDVYVDPEATSIDNVRWIAQRVVRDLDEAKRDERYSPSVRKALKGDSTPRTAVLEARDRDKRERDANRVTVWEFYDLRSRTVATFAHGSDQFLIDPVAVPYPFGHPFIFVPNYEVPDEFYPIGDLEQIEDSQQELNKTRTQLLNQRKKYNRKYIYRESAFGPEGRQALEDDGDNIAVPMMDDNHSLNDVITPMPITAMSADLYSYSDIVERDMDLVSGVNEYARGGMAEMKRLYHAG
jgi:hypothetical protein